MALAGYYKLDDLSAISASVRYFSLEISLLQITMLLIMVHSVPVSSESDLGYSRKLSDKMSLGIALRYINSNLTGGGYSNGLTTYKPGSAVAGDVSYFYTGVNEEGQGWNFGVAVTNLGTKIGYTNDATQKDYIPANLAFGTNYTKVFDESNKISFGLEVAKLMVPTPPGFTNDPTTDSINVANYRNKSVVNSWFSSFSDAPGGFSEELKEFQIQVGTEYSYNDQFFVRLGYFYEDETKGARKYVTAGLGLKYNVFGLNFSYLVPSGQGVNRNPLSNTLRFGLILDIGGGADKE